MALRPNQKAFLAAYRVCCNLTRAAEIAEIDRRRHYEWIDEDEYSAKFAKAHNEAVERLEAVAHDEALNGYAEPVVYQGQLCYEPELDKRGRPKRDKNGCIQLSSRVLTIRRRDPITRMFLLKAYRPEKYRDNYTVEHTGKDGAPLTITVRFVDTNNPSSN